MKSIQLTGAACGVFALLLTPIAALGRKFRLRRRLAHRRPKG